MYDDNGYVNYNKENIDGPPLCHNILLYDDT